MTALLEGLLLLKENTVASQIETRWQSLLAVAGQSEPADFPRYYPSEVIRLCVHAAFEGYKQMGCRPWPEPAGDCVRQTLNAAWRKFWEDPAGFVAWQRETAKSLLQKAEDTSPA